MLRPEEVEMLVCGNPELDMDALRKVTVYDGYTKNDSAIRFVQYTMAKEPRKVVAAHEHKKANSVAETFFKFTPCDSNSNRPNILR